MSKYIGAEEKIGFAKEGTRGTAESSATYYVPINDFSLDDTKEEINDGQAYGRIEDAQASRPATEWAEGSIGFNITDQSIGLLLLSVFGSVSTSTDSPEAGVNTHSYTVDSDHQHQSLTTFRKDPNNTVAFPLTVVDTFELNAAINEYVSATMDAQSKVSESATDTASYSSDTLFTAEDVTVKIDGSAVNAESFTLTIEKNLDRDHILSQKGPNDIPNTRFAVSGSIERRKEGNTYENWNLDTSYKKVELVIENTGVTIGGSTNPKLSFTMPRTRLQSYDPDHSNDDFVMETLNFKAFWDNANSKMIDGELINTVSSY